MKKRHIFYYKESINNSFISNLQCRNNREKRSLIRLSILLEDDDWYTKYKKERALDRFSYCNIKKRHKKANKKKNRIVSIFNHKTNRSIFYIKNKKLNYLKDLEQIKIFLIEKYRYRSGI